MATRTRPWVSVAAAPVALVPVPLFADASGTAGEMALDLDYLYICVADNVWKRIPLEDW